MSTVGKIGLVILTLISLPFVLVFLYIIYDQITHKIAAAKLAYKIKNNEYVELCVAHSYSISSFTDSVEIKEKTIKIPDWNYMGDDPIWIIFGFRQSDDFDFYKVKRNAVLKHFRNDDNQCKKL